MHKYQTQFDQLIDDMITSGKIQESTSGWASPIRLVQKPDGGLRMTVDFKALNNVTEKVAYPLPFIDEIFQRLSKAMYYTVLDLTSAYNQVPLHKDSRKFTAFMCRRGLYEYTVLPQGITNATETFQKLMNKIFDGILHKIVETYLDDIVIYSNTLKEHVAHVREVVQRLLTHVLKIRLAKCKIATQKLEYLSHIVYNGCIMPNPQKIKHLLQYEPPFNKKQTEAFLGKASYYKRFIKDFATIAKPLSDYIHNIQTKWTEEMTNTVKE